MVAPPAVFSSAPTPSTPPPRKYSLYKLQDVKDLSDAHLKVLKAACTKNIGSGGGISQRKLHFKMLEHDCSMLMKQEMFLKKRASKAKPDIRSHLIDCEVVPVFELGNKLSESESYVLMDPAWAEGLPDASWLKVGSAFNMGTAKGAEGVRILGEVITELQESPLHRRQAPQRRASTLTAHRDT